jgi:hypothetical protein
MARDERFLSPHDAMATPICLSTLDFKVRASGSIPMQLFPPFLHSRFFREPWLILGVGPCRTWSKHNVATHHLLPLTVLLVLTMTQSPLFGPPSAIPSAHLFYLLIPQAHALDADVRILFAAVATTRSDRFFALAQSQVEPKGSADGKFQCTPLYTSHNVIDPSRLHPYTQRFVVCKCMLGVMHCLWLCHCGL